VGTVKVRPSSEQAKPVVAAEPPKPPKLERFSVKFVARDANKMAGPELSNVEVKVNGRSTRTPKPLADLDADPVVDYAYQAKLQGYEPLQGTFRNNERMAELVVPLTLKPIPPPVIAKPPPEPKKPPVVATASPTPSGSTGGAVTASTGGPSGERKSPSGSGTAGGSGVASTSPKTNPTTTATPKPPPPPAKPKVTGKLACSTRPIGAEVWVNGKKLKNLATPFGGDKAYSLPVGTYTVEFRMPGGKERSEPQQVEIIEGETAKLINIELK
jgi:hypothetical protein